MILDDLFAASSAEYKKFIARSLAKSHILKIQNVADYYWMQTAKDCWDMSTDFPNVAPPWPRIWMEWTDSNWWLTENREEAEKIAASNSITKVTRLADGTYECRNPPGLPHRQKAVQITALLAPKWMENWADFPTKIKWLVTFLLFSPDLPDTQWLGYHTYFVADDGHMPRITLNEERIAELRKNNIYTEFPAPTLDAHFSIGGVNPQHAAVYGDILRASDGSFHVPLLALCFCHCKNVTATKQAIPDALLKKRIKNRKLPLARYYTLEIDPMRKILERSGAPKGDIQKALHICRGHFKDYRDGRGLFGKHSGLYWWEMQTRGKPAAGIVMKDYNVKTREGLIGPD